MIHKINHIWVPSMFELNTLLYSLGIVSGFAVFLWVISRIKNDVGIVDSFWSILILLAGLSFLYLFDNDLTNRKLLVLSLLSIWALRLAIHIAWRNWGQEEDHRYQTIRANNQPNFEFKSLYIVFLLQAFLALIIALPLMTVFNTGSDLNSLDYIAVALWSIGMLFEVVGDYQLHRFKSDSNNAGKVLNSGLWKYTRHPNYFGEFCIWWGFFIFAVASGYWWSIISPILLSILLLKVSGVSLLESTIRERRPEYSDYCQVTNAFFPWFPKKIAS